jgi:hypothetical protein
MWLLKSSLDPNLMVILQVTSLLYGLNENLGPPSSITHYVDRSLVIMLCITSTRQVISSW